MKTLLRFLGVICVILFLQYRLYSSDPIEGWVVDIDTGEALEGVYVAIEWNVHSFGLAGGTGIGVLKEMYTVTDKNGYFYFPAWGPVYTSNSVYKYPYIKFARKGYKIETFSQDYGSLFRSNFLIFWETLSTKWCNSLCCCKEKTAFLKKIERR